MSDLPLPLHLKIERLEHYDDDRMLHKLTIGVAGVRESLIEVDVESIFGDDAFIKTTYLCDLRLGIPDRLRHHLIHRCFEWSFANLTGGDGTVFVRQFACARRWIGRVFLTAEAEQLCRMLERYVVVGLPVHDGTILQID